jgi:hypothetical protein
MPVALLLDNPHNKLNISLTVVGWNVANSDVDFLTYVHLRNIPSSF